jgi:hypothetical protein
MRSAPHNRELAEVLVECHQDPTLAMCPREDLVVARIWDPLTRPHSVVPGRNQVFARPSPDAGVEQNFHEPVIKKGSTRSCPITRLA